MNSVKMTVLLLTCMFALTLADPYDQTQIEKYGEKFKSYKLDLAGGDPISIIETAPMEDPRDKWAEISVDLHRDGDDLAMTDSYVGKHTYPRCFGPSCREDFVEDEGPQTEAELTEEKVVEKLKDYRDLSRDRLQAISDLAAKLKKNKYNTDRYSMNDEEPEDDSRKTMTSWNRLKVKQHKHPYDDKDGWITLEPVAWSTSKVSKWKPNVKKQKPYQWNDDDDRDEEQVQYPSQQSSGGSYTFSNKKPILTRPGYINNKLHVPLEFEVETPRPTWNKLPQSYTYASSWSSDDGRKPHKPNCDSAEHYQNDGVLFDMQDSLVTDKRPSQYPYEYEALHQAVSQKRPLKRPTQVVYAGSPDLDSDRSSGPPFGDGQWVLLSTTKGYRNKKRQRSLNVPEPGDSEDYVPITTSHQAVALTVLPTDKAHTNMTTSHGGLLEVEKSFKTVEQSKHEMDKRIDLTVSSSNHKPSVSKVIKRKVIASAGPDSSTVLAAVGAGMLPATMAMVVPMMLGRKRRRRDMNGAQELSLDNLYRYR